MKKYPLHITNHFNSMNSLKARIHMVYSKQYSRRQLLRFVLVLPLSLGSMLVYAFNTPTPAQITNVMNVSALPTPPKKESQAKQTPKNTVPPLQPNIPQPQDTLIDEKMDAQTRARITEWGNMIAAKYQAITVKYKNSQTQLSENKLTQAVHQNDSLRLPSPITPLDSPSTKKSFKDYSVLYTKGILTKTTYSYILSRGSEYIFQVVDANTNKAIEGASIQLTTSRYTNLINSKSATLMFTCTSTSLYYITIRHPTNSRQQAKILVRKKN